MQPNTVLAPFAPLAVLAVPAHSQNSAQSKWHAISLNQFAANNHTVPAKIKVLKLYAIKWHTAFAAASFLIYFAAGVNVHAAERLPKCPPLHRHGYLVGGGSLCTG